MKRRSQVPRSSLIKFKGWCDKCVLLCKEVFIDQSGEGWQ